MKQKNRRDNRRFFLSWSAGKWKQCAAHLPLCFRSSSISVCSAQEGHDSQKNRQKRKADSGKEQEKAFPIAGEAASIFSEGDETGQRSYQRPGSPHIDAYQETTGILCEATEEDGCRDIADDLAGECGDQHRPMGQKPGEQGMDRFHPGKITRKGKKGNEGS